MNLIRKKCRARSSLLRKPFGNERGQSVVEYILMMGLIVTIVMVLFGQMKKNQFFFNKFTKPIVSHMIYNYKYGDPAAQGWDEGNPRKHIQISQPNANATFRLFQPEKSQ